MKGTAYHFGAHPNSLRVLDEVRVSRSLVFCLMICIIVCPYSFSVHHCIVCLSIYGFWLPLRYLQTFLVRYFNTGNVMLIEKIPQAIANYKYNEE